MKRQKLTHKTALTILFWRKIFYPASYSFEWNVKFLFHTKLLITWGCGMILTFEFMVTGWKNSKIVNDPYLVLKKKHCNFLLYTNIAYHPKVCHDFVPSSFGQVQCHWQEKSKIRVRSIAIFYWETLEVLISHKRCFMTLW